MYRFGVSSKNCFCLASRQRSRQQFTTMPHSQVRNWDCPLNRERPRIALTQASWATSSAAEYPARRSAKPYTAAACRRYKTVNASSDRAVRNVAMSSWSGSTVGHSIVMSVADAAHRCIPDEAISAPRNRLHVTADPRARRPRPPAPA